MVKVSVIVPFYNTEEYFEKCLDSLKNQTLKDIEIILVDDGSSDSSLSIAQKYSSKDERIKILTQKHSRQGAARNKGLEAAQGEYAGFVDSDDWVDLNYFEKLYDAAKRNNADIALAANIRIGNGKTKKRLKIKEEKLYTTFEDMCLVSKQAKNPCPTNKIYRKTMLEENNVVWPEGVYFEDKLFTARALFCAKSLVTVPDISYYYFRNPHSTVKSDENAEKMRDKERAKASVVKFLKENNAQIKDGIFSTNTHEIKLFKIPVFSIKESTKTRKILLFGIIPITIFEFKTPQIIPWGGGD